MTNLNTMGQELATAVAKMHLAAPDGSPLYIYTDENGNIQTVTVRDKQDVDYSPCLFHLVGKDSPQFRARQAKVQAQLMKLMRTKQLEKRSAEESENMDIETIATALVGWENIPWSDTPNGKTYFIDYTTDNAIKVLKGYRPAMEQADEFVAERANFLGKR
ncbi:MAG: hypothetical protein CML61_10055 [Rhodobacteraceae bacterium]|nr:hypothetical protein [Paracoccaceae bacterium]|tara:strand:- start:102 stop:584 length:483 start_codon:yes stop_codon:yes gene_type:complete